MPVIYTAHHASHDYGEFEPRVALTNEQKIRFSDYGTEQTVPLNGIATIVADKSRAIGDLNRAPDDSGLFPQWDFGRPERREVWLPGKELTSSEQRFCRQEFYEPFHDEIVKQLKESSAVTFVVAWDNTAHYDIGKDSSGQTI